MELNEVLSILTEVSKELEQLTNINVDRTSSVQNLYSRTEQIAKDVKDITTVLNNIKNLSDSLKIVSLNAKIEASRAGEAGKTFHVVAEEVTKQSVAIKELQNNANKYTKHINSEMEWLIETLKKSTEDIETTTATLEEINTTVEELKNNTKIEK